MELLVQPLLLWRLVLGCRSLELLAARCPEQFVCTVRTLPEEQNEPDAAFSLCHTHSAITLLDLVGERKKEGRTLKRDLELERVSCQGLNFILLLVVS